MADKTRIVVWYDEANKVCRVWPPLAIGATGDHVMWFNRTGAPIDVHVDKGLFDQNNPTDLRGIPDRDHNKPPVNITDGAGQGHFAYKVYCYRTHSYAVGNSEPEIIVE